LEKYSSSEPTRNSNHPPAGITSGSITWIDCQTRGEGRGKGKEEKGIRKREEREDTSFFEVAKLNLFAAPKILGFSVGVIWFRVPRELDLRRGSGCLTLITVGLCFLVNPSPPPSLLLPPSTRLHPWSPSHPLFLVRSPSPLLSSLLFRPKVEGIPN
jgi:hypothetical protein